MVYLAQPTSTGRHQWLSGSKTKTPCVSATTSRISPDERPAWVYLDRAAHQYRGAGDRVRTDDLPVELRAEHVGHRFNDLAAAEDRRPAVSIFATVRRADAGRAAV